MSWKGAYEGAIMGYALSGKLGALLGGLLGDASENSNIEGKLEEKSRRLHYAFFHCMGALVGSNAERSLFASSILREWNFAYEISQELLAEFNACRSRRSNFSSLVKSLNRAADAFSDVDGFDSAAIKRNITKLFCMLIPVDNPVAWEWDAMKDAGKLLGTAYIVEAFISEYYIYNRTGGVPLMPLDESYDTLKISSSASDREIKQAFRLESVKQTRCGVNGIGFFTSEYADGAERYYRRIVSAYKSLCLARRIK